MSKAKLHQMMSDDERTLLLFGSDGKSSCRSNNNLRLGSNSSNDGRDNRHHPALLLNKNRAVIVLAWTFYLFVVVHLETLLITSLPPCAIRTIVVGITLFATLVVPLLCCYVLFVMGGKGGAAASSSLGDVRLIVSKSTAADEAAIASNTISDKNSNDKPCSAIESEGSAASYGSGSQESLRLPSPPTSWPQAPILVRPSPGSDTKIRGIRYAEDCAAARSKEDFDGQLSVFGGEGGCHHLPVNTGREKKGRSIVIDFESPLFVGTVLMRIKGIRGHNSKGPVPPDDPVDVNVDTDEDDDDEEEANDDDENFKEDGSCYFDGKRRKFQAVVRGKFKRPGICMSRCYTGQAFDRPAGNASLPSRWIVNSFFKFFRTLSPQLRYTTVDCPRPRFLSPLCATAHTVLARDLPPTRGTAGPNKTITTTRQNWRSDYVGAVDIDQEDMEEPLASSVESLMQALPAEYTTAPRSKTEEQEEEEEQQPMLKIPASSRLKARKAAFNNLSANNDAGDKKNAPEVRVTFDVNKEYTFEFYQHLLVFTDDDDLKLDLGWSSMLLGKYPLSAVMDGQPIKFMSCYEETDPVPNDDDDDNPVAVEDKSDATLETLWSFDLWHQGMYPYAKAAVEAEQRQEGGDPEDQSSWQRS